jgi:hypothetical protein
MRDSLGRSPIIISIMEERYAVILDGRKIGTVNLDPAHRGSITARLAPLPAFRHVARQRNVLAAGKKRDESYPSPDPTPGDVAAEEGAQAVLEALRLSLADERTGVRIETKSIKLLQRDPPHLRVQW